MKRLVLLAMLAVGFLSVASAQTWTATDMNGGSQDISTHLNAGKAVLVDVSAHWCGPCWAWHTGGVMEDLYHDFGPDGTDEFMVFFIDGDAASSVALLQGGSGSQGDWTAGTDYPIIGPNGEGARIRGLYGTTAYPTLYLHCSGQTGNAPEISRAAKWTFWNNIRSMCPSAFNSETVDATMLLNPDPVYACGGSADLVFDVYNAGTTNLTSFDVEVRDPNGTLVHTENVTGANVAPGAFTSVTYAVSGATAGTYTAKVVNPNGTTDPRPNGDEESYEIIVAPTGTDPLVTVTVTPDDYGSEITWTLKDPNGTTVLSGGPYQDNDNTPKVETFTASADGCYTFTINDSYGDGICCSYGQGSYSVTSGSAAMGNGSEYASSDSRSFELALNPNSIAEDQLNGISLYPNPTKDASNLVFTVKSANVDVLVMNTMGQVVKTMSLGQVSGQQQVAIDTRDLAAGVYKVAIKAGDVTQVKRLSVVK